MSACHTKPVLLPGVIVDTRGDSELPACPVGAVNAECCDYCGSERIEWRKCKLICVECRQINKSCADL